MSIEYNGWVIDWVIQWRREEKHLGEIVIIEAKKQLKLKDYENYLIDCENLCNQLKHKECKNGRDIKYFIDVMMKKINYVENFKTKE